MDKQEEAYVVIPAQIGDSNASSAVSPHIMDLVKLLDRYCNNHYAENIDEFTPILRVDGDIGHWDFEGLQRLRLMKKKRYITVDIGMPKSRWQNVPPEKIKQYLFDNLKLALEAFVQKLKKEHISVDEQRLFTDLKNVEREYLV
jgi:hypothetical protein